MIFLLDTHTFIWLATQPERISARLKELLDSDDAQLLVSVGSIWEMAIKVGLGKLTLDFPISEFVERACSDFGVDILQIEPRHLFRLTSLPHHHRDPFDRLLVAQVEIEGIILVSCDTHFDAYAVKRLW